MPLKESMEYLAESISAFANSNLGAEITVETNVQNFLRAFQEYNAEHMPDVVCLVELRVSGKKANLIIEKLGFNYSHRVEAVGFSKDTCKRKLLWEGLRSANPNLSFP
ncbi:hypothetical protein Golax_012759 [Gossypium laxum]|uniref:Uncharacterized protein n=1 Tax=Gossypium laxum TaxID=34288 RepID=A0A7J8ZPJ4_9ROSI|nr:hypothetical protein [Gossypium laxum]